MERPMRVIFAGGGTFGHLSPGLAVAEYLGASDSSHEISFVGRDEPREAALLAAAGFPHQSLPCRGVPRRWGDLLAALAVNFRGCRGAWQLLGKHRPDVVVGLGGYASAAMCAAACCRRIPLVLLEQNAIPGHVTRWFAPWAHTVCTSYAQSENHLSSGARVVLTGNPVRPAFLRQLPPHGRHARGRTPTLIVLGGTRGAAALNAHVPQVFVRLRAELSGWRILHQAGPDRGAELTTRYQRLGLSVEVRSHFEDLASILGPNTVAISRAGGSILAELAVTGTPAILVPYPFAAAAHQDANAGVAVAAGAAFSLRQAEVEQRPEALATALRLLLDVTIRGRMSAAMRRISHPQAAAAVAAVCEAAAMGRVEAGSFPGPDIAALRSVRCRTYSNSVHNA